MEVTRDGKEYRVTNIRQTSFGSEDVPYSDAEYYYNDEWHPVKNDQMRVDLARAAMEQQAKGADENFETLFSSGKYDPGKASKEDVEVIKSLTLLDRLKLVKEKIFPKSLSHVEMGAVPQTVQNTIGMKIDAPLAMQQNKAYDAMVKEINEDNRHHHNLGADGLSQIPKALESPLRAFEQNNGRYGFVVEIKDGKTPVYVSLELDATGNYRGNYEPITLVVTAFGTDQNYIENQAANGTELQIKKEPRAQVNEGRQLPNIVNAQSLFSGEVPSPKNIIPQSGEKSNIEQGNIDNEQAADYTDEARIKTICRKRRDKGLVTCCSQMASHFDYSQKIFVNIDCAVYDIGRRKTGCFILRG